LTPIPGGFFDPGSDPFSGIVAFDTAGQNDEAMRVQAPDLQPPPPNKNPGGPCSQYAEAAKTALKAAGTQIGEVSDALHVPFQGVPGSACGAGY
jgi:hypothetical protein